MFQDGFDDILVLNETDEFTTTLAPSRAKRKVISSPIPHPATVTTATLSLSFTFDILLFPPPPSSREKMYVN